MMENTVYFIGGPPIRDEMKYTVKLTFEQYFRFVSPSLERNSQVINWLYDKVGIDNFQWEITRTKNHAYLLGSPSITFKEENDKVMFILRWL